MKCWHWTWSVDETYTGRLSGKKMEIWLERYLLLGSFMLCC